MNRYRERPRVAVCAFMAALGAGSYFTELLGLMLYRPLDRWGSS